MIDHSTFVIPDHAYLTLPLAALPALRSSDKPTDLANKLIDLAIVKMAEHFKTKYTSDEVYEVECMQSGESIEDWSERNQNCFTEIRPHLALACLFLGINIGELEWIDRRAESAQKEIHSFDYNTSAVFSILKRDLFDLREGKMPLKDFLVLAAIRSILGIKAKSIPPRRITRDQIAARIMGYSRVRDIPEENRDGLLCEASLKRVGRVADKLAKQERFTRWTGFKRETYYHVSMTESQIADFVTEKKCKAAYKRIEGLKAEVESKDKLEAVRQQEAFLKETLSRMK